MPPPRIGITVDSRHRTDTSGKYEAAIAYCRYVAEAGGLPLLLPHEVALADLYVNICEGLLLTGECAASTEPFGEPTHPEVRPTDPQQQAFELALLKELEAHPYKPVLGVGLGMQLMALHAGGKLHQYLPEALGEGPAAIHHGNREHGIIPTADDGIMHDLAQAAGPSAVVSDHRQAVRSAGSLRVTARAAEGLIEAVEADSQSEHTFYVGVQWHPERAEQGKFNRPLFARLVAVARQTR